MYLPEQLRRFVAADAMVAVAAHLAGRPAECRWDPGSPDPLKAALGELWWACYDRYLTDYRDDTPFGG